MVLGWLGSGPTGPRPFKRAPRVTHRPRFGAARRSPAGVVGRLAVGDDDRNPDALHGVGAGIVGPGPDRVWPIRAQPRVPQRAIGRSGVGGDAHSVDVELDAGHAHVVCGFGGGGHHGLQTRAGRRAAERNGGGNDVAGHDDAHARLGGGGAGCRVGHRQGRGVGPGGRIDVGWRRTAPIEAVPEGPVVGKGVAVGVARSQPGELDRRSHGALVRTARIGHRRVVGGSDLEDEVIVVGEAVGSQGAAEPANGTAPARPGRRPGAACRRWRSPRTPDWSGSAWQ